jgi:hypothetical protein
MAGAPFNSQNPSRKYEGYGATRVTPGYEGLRKATKGYVFFFFRRKRNKKNGFLRWCDLHGYLSIGRPWKSTKEYNQTKPFWFPKKKQKTYPS